ncbi:MAG: transporter permease [Frankiales bacterium]|nr:transporter permease [Frankiales bacterium]
MNAVWTARRVLAQLSGDRRTLALLLLVPCVLTGLLAWVFQGSPGAFDRVGPPLLAVFPLTTMFVVTSVAMLRERTSGTLERLLTTPLRKIDLLLGYALAFGVLAVAQTALLAGLALPVLGLRVLGPAWQLVVAALASALLGTSLGLLGSAFARTEFQAVQLLPAFVLPQLLLCGLFVPRPRMPRPLRAAADVLPLTYVVDAMQRVGTGRTGAGLAVDLAVSATFVAGALALGALTLRRRTA